MFTKIEEDKAETIPEAQQYIAFKSGDWVFAGVYVGEKKASPFTMKSATAPVFAIEEWMPIRVWN